MCSYCSWFFWSRKVCKYMYLGYVPHYGAIDVGLQDFVPRSCLVFVAQKEAHSGEGVGYTESDFSWPECMIMYLNTISRCKYGFGRNTVQVCGYDRAGIAALLTANWTAVHSQAVAAARLHPSAAVSINGLIVTLFGSKI